MARTIKYYLKNNYLTLRSKVKAGLYNNIFFNLSLRTTNLKQYFSDSIFQLSEKIYKNYKNQRIIIQGSHYFQIRERSDFSFREFTRRSGETSGRSQLRLIETLFHDPSDITLPKFSKQMQLKSCLNIFLLGFYLFITTLSQSYEFQS